MTEIPRDRWGDGVLPVLPVAQGNRLCRTCSTETKRRYRERQKELA